MEDSQVQRRVGAAFAQLRSSKNLSPAALAKDARVDVKTLRAFEAGERWPQDTTRAKIEESLGLLTGTAERLRAKLLSLDPDNHNIDRRIRDIMQPAVDISWRQTPLRSTPNEAQAADMAQQLRSLASLVRDVRNRAVHLEDVSYDELVQAVVTADALITVIVQNMGDVLGQAALRNRVSSPTPIAPHPDDSTRPTHTSPDADSGVDVLAEIRDFHQRRQDSPVADSDAARRGPGPTKGEQLREQLDREAEAGDPEGPEGGA